jgi:hypothetical protein
MYQSLYYFEAIFSLLTGIIFISKGFITLIYNIIIKDYTASFFSFILISIGSIFFYILLILYNIK